MVLNPEAGVLVLLLVLLLLTIIFIIISLSSYIANRDAVADGIFLAVHVHFRFADIDTFATNLWFALHCSLQTNSRFDYDTLTQVVGLLLWYEITARGIIRYAHLTCVIVVIVIVVTAITKVYE